LTAACLFQKKRTTPGSGLKAAARDPYLEIDVSGKSLADDGLAEFIDELIACFNYRDDDHPEGVVKLSELSLKGNKLTVISFKKLAEVIRRSHGDLKELDISDNEITVETSEQIAIWKEFLGSFRGCYVLKRIDFSGNKLGAKGFELLCQSYMQSDLDFVESSKDETLESPEEDNKKDGRLTETMSSLKLGDDKENLKPSPEQTRGNKGRTNRPGMYPSKWF
jgi:Leucine-rich repeat (LRR) protein